MTKARICDWCNEPITTQPHVTYNERHFCNHKCLGHYLMRIETDPTIFKEFLEMYNMDDTCAEFMGMNYVDAEEVCED